PKAPDPVLPWLFRVVRNGAISASRTERRRRLREREVAARSAPWFLPDATLEVDAALLHPALVALPAEERGVIVADVWGGLTFEQVGDLTGCSTSMAYRRYSAGLETLRARLGEVPCPTKRAT